MKASKEDKAEKSAALKAAKAERERLLAWIDDSYIGLLDLDPIFFFKKNPSISSRFWWWWFFYSFWWFCFGFLGKKKLIPQAWSLKSYRTSLSKRSSLHQRLLDRCQVKYPNTRPVRSWAKQLDRVTSQLFIMRDFGLIWCDFWNRMTYVSDDQEFVETVRLGEQDHWSITGWVWWIQSRLQMC